LVVEYVFPDDNNCDDDDDDDDNVNHANVGSAKLTLINTMFVV